LRRSFKQGKAETIRLVNEAAEKYFVGNAQELKKLEMIENSMRDNAKIVLTEHGISPTLLLGSLPITVSPDGKREPNPDEIQELVFLPSRKEMQWKIK